MDLSIGFIADRLSQEFEVELLNVSSNPTVYAGPRFSTARIATPAPCSSTTKVEGDPLIIATESTPLSCLSQAKGVLYLSSRRPELERPCIWIKNCTDSIVLLNDLLDLEDFYESWFSRVREALLRQEPIENVAMLLGEVTSNPFWYGDTALHALAISDDRGLSALSEKWRVQQATRHYPSHDITKLVTSGDLARMDSEHGAVLFDGELSTYNMPFVSRTIFRNGEAFGHLFIIELQAEEQRADLELIDGFGTLIETYLAHAPKVPSSNGQIIEQVLRSKISGVPLAPEERNSLLEILAWEDAEVFLLAVFDRNLGLHNDDAPPRAQVQLVRDHLPGRAFSYKNVIVLIVDTTEGAIGTLTRRIERLCAQTDWRAGISAPFASVDQLDTAYKQAATSLGEGERAGKSERIYKYGDYCLSYLCEQISSCVEPAMYMHPYIERVMRVDKEKGSSLLLTLEAYLDNERSISQTANQLYMHRNSVLYRIDKIRDLIGGDELDDNDERFVALLSLKVLHHEHPELFEQGEAKHTDGQTS